MSRSTKNVLPENKQKEILNTLLIRFEKNVSRHKGLKWNLIQDILENKPEKLWSLYEMEASGGEPDVVFPFPKNDAQNKNAFVFIDCSNESPVGRRSICYDQEALDSRKEHKPENNAVDMAEKMGVELLDEEQYRELQKFGEFDSKTSSWIKTPSEIRKLGGALFADYRYKHVFIYHNGASSYYAARGFRGILHI